MKIKIEKSVDHYRADCLDLPGSPPVGLGESKEMAVTCLFWMLLKEEIWIKYLTNILNEPIIINGEKWKYPESYLKFSPH